MRHPRLRGKSLDDRATLANRVGAIRSPMLIVVGELDRLRPLCETLHARVPHSEYRVVDGAPHNVYYEAAPEYNALVADFLGRVLAPATAQVAGS
ncbi:MAG: alpha/beta fold hydrolase [Dehalococcoidia bacterium]